LYNDSYKYSVFVMYSFMILVKLSCLLAR
jgi:hypothetical protein